MPELLRAYGDMLRQKQGGELVVFAVLTALVLLVLAVITMGALVEAALRVWARSRAKRKTPPSTSSSDVDRGNEDEASDAPAQGMPMIAADAQDSRAARAPRRAVAVPVPKKSSRAR